MSDEIPRRIRMDKMVPAELAILKAMEAVEGMGAHPLLTEAVVLLGQAKDKVSDIVDHHCQFIACLRPLAPDDKNGTCASCAAGLEKQAW